MGKNPFQAGPATKAGTSAEPSPYKGSTVEPIVIQRGGGASTSATAAFAKIARSSFATQNQDEIAAEDLKALQAAQKVQADKVAALQALEAANTAAAALEAADEAKRQADLKALTDADAEALSEQQKLLDKQNKLLSDKMLLDKLNRQRHLDDVDAPLPNPPSEKSAVPWIIGGLLIVAAGAGLYFATKKPASKKTEASK